MEGTIKVAARMVAAEARFIEWAMEAALCTQAEAEAILKTYRKAKAVKFDPIGGQFTLTHGGFADPAVLSLAIVSK